MKMKMKMKMKRKRSYNDITLGNNEDIKSSIQRITYEIETSKVLDREKLLSIIDYLFYNGKGE